MNEAAVLALYEAVPEPIAVVDARSRLRSTNAAWRALHASDPELPLRASLAVGDSDAARLEATVTAVATAGSGRRTVAVFGSVEGRVRFFELSAAAITLRGEGGAAEHLVVLHHHADAQNEDAALGARLSEHVLEQWPHMIFIKEAAELRFVYGNRVCEELVGMPRSQFIGKCDYDFFPREQADFFTARDRDVFTGRRMIVIAEEPIESPKHGHRLLRTWKYR